MRNGRHEAILEGLLADPDIARMAGFANSCFKLWSPHVYDDVGEKLRALYEHDLSLKKNWRSNVYPCAAFNFGPCIICKCHRDSGNTPHTWCAIQALGNFDPKKRDICSTILILSALFTHGNTPVAEGETRLSFMQFVPGGLLQFVDNRFMTETQLRKKSKKLWGGGMAEKPGRWRKNLEMICTLDELTAKYVSPSSATKGVAKRK
ncbi:hypothetical protein DFP72DRAFT_989672 [Ephemerocybe angulata]|uniref:Uncharacterized protein n=1 Tax=Ephemerocybe angulata TaxID=980116 RepID=A0A8H6I099_9AGAR|nr:hypothetical protein DFP72DRAFT_989672 [Tulosesus angulatus]